MSIAIERSAVPDIAAPVYEFCGLTSDEMHRFVSAPFDSPGLVTFNLTLQRFPDAPFFRLLLFLLNGLAGEGLKMTAKGNLSRSFVREAIRWFFSENNEKERMRYDSCQSETDFYQLHIVRLVAEMSGMIQTRDNRFQTTGTGDAVLKNGLSGRSFLELFKAYTMKLNWAYCDRYPDLPAIQASFLFMLYALDKYGETWRPASFYEDLFLSAFPGAIRDIPGDVYETPEHALKRSFSLRMMSRFALFFGFIEIREQSPDRRGGPGEFRKTSFLDEWIVFHEQ